MVVCYYTRRQLSWLERKSHHFWVRGRGVSPLHKIVLKIDARDKYRIT